ncbi:MAG: tetratricopeptide repeat protein [Myxococcota bacterium]
MTSRVKSSEELGTVGNMIGSYTTRQVANLLHLPAGQIRAYARAGLVGTRKGSGQKSKLLFDFRDMAVLRVAKRLASEGLSYARVERALVSLQRRNLRRVGAEDRRSLSDGSASERPLSGLALAECRGHVVASDDGRTWEADTGQYFLRFDSERESGRHPEPTIDERLVLRPRVVESITSGPASGEPEEPHDTASCHSWFELAVELEEKDPPQSYQAYLRVLAIDPEHVEAMINIGRLCSAAGEVRRAAAYFRQAIRVDPTQPVAHFNLGVTLHDLGDVHGAIVAYRTALIHERNFADAHYNLSSLLEQQGDQQGALLHMNAYRVASQDSD